MTDWYGVLSKSRGGKQRDGQDLQEEEVWAVIREREDSSSRVRKVREKSTPSRVMISSENQEVKMSSAPVNITDWSKLHKKGLMNGSCSVLDDDDDVNDDDGEMVPPHEYIARRLARTQIASFSMCEGVGRTLKGRDLSKLRNAILTKTGFLEK